LPPKKNSLSVSASDIMMHRSASSLFSMSLSRNEDSEENQEPSLYMKTPDRVSMSRSLLGRVLSGDLGFSAVWRSHRRSASVPHNGISNTDQETEQYHRHNPFVLSRTVDHISPRTQVTHRTLEGDSFDYYMLFLV